MAFYLSINITCDVSGSSRAGIFVCSTISGELFSVGVTVRRGRWVEITFIACPIVHCMERERERKKGER